MRVYVAYINTMDNVSADRASWEGRIMKEEGGVTPAPINAWIMH